MTVSTADAPKANARPGDEDVAPVDTSPFIMGAFTPRTDEARVEFRLEDAVVLGAFPNDLVGTFLRIGPNPKFDFTGKPYHVFDGDGMIHSTRFASDGSTALYQNKWVQTKAMDFEAQANYSFSVIGEMDALEQTGNMNWIPHVSNPDNIGRANTALVFHPPTKKRLRSLKSITHINGHRYSFDGRAGRNVWRGCAQVLNIYCPSQGVPPNK